MYYGVFTKDLKGISFGESSLETCRKYLRKGHVICSEKEITTGFEIKIQFHKRPHWFWKKWAAKKDVGFVSFEFRKLKYYWADKVVAEDGERPDEERPRRDPRGRRREMRLWSENKEFLRRHHLTINMAIAILMEQERDANEVGATLFKEKEGANNGK